MAPSDPDLWPGLDPDLPAHPDPIRPWHRWWSNLRSLQARLTLVVIGSLAVGIGSISALSLGQLQSDLLARTQAREIAQTARIADDLSQRAVGLQQVLRLTADQLSADLPGSDEQLSQRLSAQPVLLQQFANIFVSEPGGQLRLLIDDAGSRRPNVSIADRDYFRRLVAEQRPLISEPVPGRVSGEPVIIFAHPIVRRGQTIAVIGGAVRLSSRNLAASMLNRDGDDDASELLAISDEAGLAIAHPMRDLLLKRLSQDPRLSEAVRDWEEHGSPAEPTGVLLQQAGEIVTAAGVAGTNWIVWRATPEAALLEPLSKAREQALRNAVAVTAVLGLLTLWIVRRQLRPLRQLAARAQDLFAAGKDVHDGWPQVGGEVGAVVEVLRHVGAERAHLEAFTAQLLGQLNSVMSAAPLGIAFTRHQRFELVNQAWCRLVLHTERDLVGSPAAMLFADPGDHARLGALVAESFAREGGYAGEWRLRRQDGTVFWGQLNGRPVDAADADAGTIWTLADVTAVRESRELLEWSANHDPLTGLANRAAFERRLNVVIAHPPAALLLIDLDRFKPINDRHGHGAGDAMLQQVAEALQSHVRAGDLAVRLGGDEFAVILERCPLDAAPRVAATVLQAITAARVIWEGHTLSVGASIGVALLSDDPASRPADTAAWVAAADKACYDAKASGRGVVRLAGPPPSPEAGARAAAQEAAEPADNAGDAPAPDRA